MSEDLYQDLRQQMMAEIVAEAALTAGHTGLAAFSERVMSIIGAMPRHEFVPVELQPYAYLNRPLPIGYEKTISQPFIVALMTDLLAPHENDVVLEVGAGAGYQAAILAQLVKRVYTVDDRIMVTTASELIPPPLLAQLKPGGRMVIPTGIPDKQTLTLVEKSASGSLATREILPVRFSELEDPGETVGAA
jgi:protein-L-isoaspartate(D-aspartate) O-methyltransferase